MRYVHQFDDKGNHRLGSAKEAEIKWGNWASYQSPAMLGQYLAVTEYYRDSREFPNPKVMYQIQVAVWPLESETV